MPLKALLLACFLLFACPQKAEVREAPVPAEARWTVLAASIELREFYNRGLCQIIYERHASLRGIQANEWKAECDDLRAKLGQWKRLEEGTVTKCGNDRVLCCEGRAVFANGTYQQELTWLIHDGQATLLWWTLHRDGESHWLPKLPLHPLPTDPPLTPPRSLSQPMVS